MSNSGFMLRRFSSVFASWSVMQRALCGLSTNHDIGKIHGLPVVYHPLYSAPQLKPGHRFPMDKFRTIYDILLKQGTVQEHQVVQPPSIASDEQILQVHTKEYVESFSNCTLDDKQVRRIGFGDATRTNALVERTKAEVAGTLLTAEIALRTGLACNLAGGTHHAFPEYGSGYCIINDLAVTAKILLNTGLANRILILDLDVHQGDGTASIFSNEPRVFCISVHCESNFPARKQQSDLDIGLPDGMQDEEYLKVIAGFLPDRLRSFQPDIVLYDAGVDPHKDDPLGRLCLTNEGLMRREMMVMDCCLSAGIPLANFTGGGYDDNVNLVAQRHCFMVEAATQMWKDHKL
ncbi:hypothetical protein BSKO_10305 [Bryopsis sp. KO-2023]|nr:hypothetical protein BSKO_10305 [Bryopsis sp. KO-2023]